MAIRQIHQTAARTSLRLEPKKVRSEMTDTPEAQTAAVRGFVLRSAVLGAVSLAAIPVTALGLSADARPLVCGASGALAAAAVCAFLAVRAVQGRLAGARESQPLIAVAAGVLVRMLCLGVSLAAAAAIGSANVLTCGIFFLALFPVFRASEAVFLHKALAAASSAASPAIASPDPETETPLQESRP